jgi:hypothetical protein
MGYLQITCTGCVQVIERYVVGESAAPPAQPMQQPPAPPGPPQLAPTPPRRAMPGAAPPDLPAASQSDGKDKSHGRLVRVVTIIAAASVFVGLLVGAAICLMRGCITSRSRSATCAHLVCLTFSSVLPLLGVSDACYQVDEDAQRCLLLRMS